MLDRKSVIQVSMSNKWPRREKTLALKHLCFTDSEHDSQENLHGLNTSSISLYTL